MRSLLIASVLLSTATSPALADDDAAHPAATSPEIIVTAPYQRDRTDVLSGTSVVTGDALVRDLRPTIGDTLARQPGVSATSFGPNASRPVLRGFQGERVRVLTDGIGSFDVSNTSVDHAVVINQLTADRIEVLRGPAALLFGSSAIGGVVNVVDKRIPRTVPDELAHIEMIGSYGSAANERSSGAVLDVPVTSKVVLHVDGTYTRTSDLEVGGALLSPQLRARALASPDATVRDLAALSGHLPNSAGRTWDVAGGAAVITETGNFGFAVSHYESVYGVPVRFSLDPATQADRVRLDVNQTRLDGRAEVSTDGGIIDKVRFRGGYADYHHSEIDPSGAIGTTFFNKGWEGRLELVQARRGGWQGAVGGQFFLRNLNIVGDEKFLPKSETQQFGLFTLQSADLGAIKAEVGARYEKSILAADADATLGNARIRHSFDTVSGSIGASYQIVDGWRVGLSGSHTERAPSAEELFANGPHAGTQAFEIGDPTFGKETSNGIEATLRGGGTGYTVSFSAWHSWFDGFIYEAQTGAIRDNLPVFQNRQASARYLGVEGEATVKLADFGAVALSADALGDFTRATIIGIGPAPRIPAIRLLGGLEAKAERATGRLEVEWVDRQDRVATFETPTDGYTLVNASITLKPFDQRPQTSLIVSANNIFDVDARRHASFLKDYAPLAGRDIRVSVRTAF